MRVLVWMLFVSSITTELDRNKTWAEVLGSFASF
jgi:hypothetical protein